MDMIGHNRPPVSPDELRAELTDQNTDLIARTAELTAAAARVPDEIIDESTAEMATDFVKQITAAWKLGDVRRVDAKEPFLNLGRAVDGFFKKLTSPLDDAKASVLKKLTAYQRAKEAAARAERERVAREQREAAEAAVRAAREAEAAIQKAADLESAIEAQRAADQAAADAEAAAKAATAKAATLSRTRGDFGAVASLRTFWDFRNLDRDKIDLELLRPHLAFADIEKALRSYIKAGGREITGAEIFENHSTTVR